jgi:hypothetical protein
MASLLRFLSPRTAWLIGAQLTFSHERDNAAGNSPFVASTSGSHTLLGVSARTGARWYHGSPGALRPFTTLGLLGSYQGIGDNSGSGSGYTSRFWSVGAFGEVGAIYAFTPHVSLGASSQLDAQYQTRHANSPGGSLRGRGVLFNASVLSVLGAVYF